MGVVRANLDTNPRKVSPPGYVAVWVAAAAVWYSTGADQSPTPTPRHGLAIPWGIVGNPRQVFDP